MERQSCLLFYLANHQINDIILHFFHRAGANAKVENQGCFGSSKSKRKDSQTTPQRENPSSSRGPRSGPIKGMDLLWQSEVNKNISPFASKVNV